MVQISWSTPRTWVAGAVLTAAQLNSNLRDNFNYLRSNATATVSTSEATASSTFTDLATVGPAVTVTTDVQALVMLYCNLGGNNSIMSFAVSGASTVAAAEVFALYINSVAGVPAGYASAIFLVTGLTAGSNTFTGKYRSNSGSASFVTRRITVIPC